MAKKVETEKPAYGQAAVLDAAAEAAEEATVVPPPGPEAVAVEAAIAGETPATGEETPANEAIPPQGQPQGPPGFQVRNRFNLLPPNVNFEAAQTRKTPVEEDYDASLLFRALALESPEFRIIADELSRGE